MSLKCKNVPVRDDDSKRNKTTSRRARASDTHAPVHRSVLDGTLGPPGAADVLRLGAILGNNAVTRALQRATESRISRAIDATKVENVKNTLAVKGTVKAVEVPNAGTVKSGTKFSAYPKENTLNLGPLADMTLHKLNYGDVKDEQMEAEPASTIVDLMGGGAYNNEHDLLVLAEGYKDDALIHEMGHKAQDEQGVSTKNAVTIVLEYHNVLKNQNRAWAAGEKDAPPPRVWYDKNPKLKGRAKTWADLKAAVKAKWHHDMPQTGQLLDEIETMLAGRYSKESDSKGTYAEQAKQNLIAEYFNSQ